VPEHARGVLEHAHEDGDVGGVVLDRRAAVGRGDGELAELAEAREAPVALLVDEAVVCVCLRVSEGKGEQTRGARETV
jgi:hypothetical protein